VDPSHVVVDRAAACEHFPAQIALIGGFVVGVFVDFQTSRV
jgi:hypothetical protein